MYLLRLKEEVDRLATKKNIILVCVVLVLIGAVSWAVCRHYDNIERADSHDVTQTVRDTEELNRDAQTKLEDARAANQAAERANQNAQRAADSLADSNAKLSRLDESDQRAIDDAEQVFRDVDAANQ